MWKLFQPVVLPLIFIAFQALAANRKWFKNNLLIGFLLGLGVFWLLCSILCNQALLRRFPAITEWAPFLPAPTDLPYAHPLELSAPYIRHQTIRAVDLSVDRTIQGRTIEDCTIVGPAVLAGDLLILIECDFQAPHPATVFQFVQNGMIMPDGVIQVTDCTFRRCKFRDISFVIPEHIIRDSFGQEMVAAIHAAHAEALLKYEATTPTPPSHFQQPPSTP